MLYLSRTHQPTYQGVDAERSVLALALRRCLRRCSCRNRSKRIAPHQSRERSGHIARQARDNTHQSKDCWGKARAVCVHSCPFSRGPIKVESTVCVKVGHTHVVGVECVLAFLTHYFVITAEVIDERVKLIVGYCHLALTSWAWS
mgnify:CR=1 FL=1